MPREVVVTTGARLHFGFFAHGGTDGPQFGGVGVMVDRPGFVVRARRDAHDHLQCGSWSARVEGLLARLRAAGRPAIAGATLDVEIVESPPAHAGLGSGTQLALALAKAVTVLAGENCLPYAELAQLTGRGARSSIGLHGFQHGGLLVEGGKSAPDDISPLVARLAFPEEWRFLLVRPRGVCGLSGAGESNELSRLAPMPLELTARLCALALAEILPAALERDYAAASASIGRFGRLVGEYFAPVQGGLIADERMRGLAEWLIARGFEGVGQSSWGPTLFVLCPSLNSAADLAAELLGAPLAADCELTIAAPLNRGATVDEV
jgi:beta-RFAP synthase